MRRILLILVVCLVAFVGIVGQRYYTWATNASGAADPFDEMGIGLHSYMPGFVQSWGCARLKENFGTKTMPPPWLWHDGWPMAINPGRSANTHFCAAAFCHNPTLPP